LFTKPFTITFENGITFLIVSKLLKNIGYIKKYCERGMYFDYISNGKTVYLPENTGKR